MAKRPSPPEDPVFWPSLLMEVKERFGVAAALKLAAECGGRTWTVPGKATADHPIARAAGLRVLRHICRSYGRYEKITIPLGPASGYRRRIATIRRMLKEGAPSAEIVRAAECHERTVRRHRNDKRDDGEPGLFG